MGMTFDKTYVVQFQEIKIVLILMRSVKTSWKFTILMLLPVRILFWQNQNYKFNQDPKLEKNRQEFAFQLNAF